MIQLTVKSGMAKGMSWPINDRALVIGRETGCDIRIPDPVVSRRHCEIIRAGNAIQIKDLGSLNPVLVNGRPTVSCVLTVGDEVRVGHVSFILTQISDASDVAVSAAPGFSTDTLAVEESVFLSDRLPEGASEVRPQTDTDLSDLFRASRAFSRLKDGKALVNALGETVAERFRPDEAWLVTYRPSGEEIVSLTGNGKQNSVSPGLHEGAAIRDCMASRRGVLVPGKSEENGKILVRCVMTAPILLGEYQVGALALTKCTAERPFQKRDLHFLVALANIVAPFFKAIERIEELEAENRRLRLAEEKFTRLVGSSKTMTGLQRMIRLAAPSAQSVLVLGDTGTGKELVASLIHELSDRASGPFITVNCAAIPRDLFESEFFGYEKGAFTGALNRKIGLLEESHSGTLFLDEIGDLCAEHQARILRAVETGRFRRVGGDEEVVADFRVVAATNKELAVEIQQGRFRQDLYHRLRAIEIRIPALGQRRCDIPELARHFLQVACVKTKTPLRSFSPKAIEYLVSLPWPGNVRELKNVVDVANTFCQGEVIDVDELRAIAGAHDSGDAPLSLAEVERLHIVKTIEYTNGNMVETAKLLGIGRNTLYTKLAQYGLRREP